QLRRCSWSAAGRGCSGDTQTLNLPIRTTTSQDRVQRLSLGRGGMMRKVVVVAICSLVLAMVALGSAAGASARNDVFRGFWTSVDLDGSHQTLDIRGTGQSGHHAM